MCTHNPHGKGTLPNRQVVRTFTVVERHGFVWIWMAEEAADHALLPDFAPIDQGPPTGIGYTYMRMPVNYRMILDNVMDLSHVDHVHGEIITTRGQLSPLIPKVEETPTTVSASWEWRQTPPILILNQFLPRPDEEARHWIRVTWSAPGNIQLSIFCAQDDTPVLDGAGQYDLHSVTPEDDGSTHYFFCTRRNHIEHDGEYNAFKIKAMHDAFWEEDGPLIAAAESEMGGEDFFALNPMLLSNDLAAVKVRRRLRDLVGQEAE
jgi:vanillate O-demethylase monooxygenase subunit